MLGYTATLLPDGQVLVSGGFLSGISWRARRSIRLARPGRTRRRRKCYAPRRTARGITAMSPLPVPRVISDRVSRTRRTRAFNLTTNVPAGTETANAATNSRQVCDVVGNCTTAAPITGNKVDKKAPTIAIASPTAGATYGLNARSARAMPAAMGVWDDVVYRAGRKRESHQHVVHGNQDVRGDSD